MVAVVVAAVLAAGACGSDTGPTGQAGADVDELVAAGVLDPLELPGDAEWAEPPTFLGPGSAAFQSGQTARLVERCADPDEVGARVGEPADAADASEVWQAFPEGRSLFSSSPPHPFGGNVRTAALVYADEQAAADAYDALDGDAVIECIGVVVDESLAETEALVAAGQSDGLVNPDAAGDLSLIRTTETDLGLGDDARLTEHLIDVAVFGGFDHAYQLDVAVVRRGPVLLVAAVGADGQGVDPEPSADTARAVAGASLAAVDAVLAGGPLPTPTTVDPAAAIDAVLAATALDPGDLPADGGWVPAEPPTSGPLASCLAAGLATGGTSGEPIAEAPPSTFAREGRDGGRDVVAVAGALYATRRDAQAAVGALEYGLPCAMAPGTGVDVDNSHEQSFPLEALGDEAILFEVFPLPETSGARRAVDAAVVRRDRAVVVVVGEEHAIPADDPDLPTVRLGDLDGATFDGIALDGLVVDLVGPIDAAVADALG